jgi:hypothetical protein
MKIKYLWVLGLILVLPLSLHADPLGLGRVSLIQGNAQMKTGEAADWTLAPANTPIQEGDRFWCPAGARLELEFNDGTFLRIDQNSSLDVLSLKENALQAHLGMGHLFVRAGDLTGKTFQIDVPDTTILIRQPANFRVDILPDGGEDISIFRGAVDVASSGTNTRVRTGEMLTLDANSSKVEPLARVDEWEQWNEDRDRSILSAAAADHNLPPELSSYASDIDANGSWVTDPDNGDVWVPNAALTVGWVPYGSGRWVWLDGDWCWVSFDAWGWAPFHYGRWIFSNHWCWVPPRHHDAVWGRGYVGWVRDRSHVGWVPLAPGEKGNVHGVPAAGFRNAAANPHALVVVNRADFAAGKTVPVRTHENMLAPGNVTARMDVKPLPEAKRMGAAAPAGLQPAQAVRNVHVTNLRQQHPLVAPIPRTPGAATAASGQNRQVNPGHTLPGIGGTKGTAPRTASGGNRPQSFPAYRFNPAHGALQPSTHAWRISPRPGVGSNPVPYRTNSNRGGGQSRPAGGSVGGRGAGVKSDHHEH